MMDLSVVVLNYNAKEFLDKCLRSLDEGYKNYPRFNIYVVDNASKDSSVEMVKKKYPHVKLIVNKENLGFAAGNNCAIPYIKEKYVLFLNPDTIVPKETLPEMVRFMEQNPEVAVSTCKLELASGGLDTDCHRGFPTPWAAFTFFTKLSKIFPKSRIFNQYHQGYKDFNTIHEIDSCVGAFMLVRTKAAQEVGWWDPDYFFYGEDLDWNYRFKKSGWKVMYNPKVKTIHYKGISSGIRAETKQLTTADIETKKRSYQAAAKAMAIFYAKHYNDQYSKLLSKLILWSINLILWFRLKKLERSS